MTAIVCGSQYTEQDGDTLVCGFDRRNGGSLLVYRHRDGSYAVVVDGISRHLACDAEAVMRALTHYLYQYLH